MTILQSGIAQSAAAATGYQITRSLRFNQPDSAYLNRTLTTPTSRRIYTSSSWIKRSGLGVTAFLSAVGPNPGTWDAIRFDTNDTLSIRFSADTYALSTTQVFRDVSSWYHIVIAVDTTQATSSNRVKVYVNGVQVTAFSGSYPVQNLDTAQLSGNLTRIGSSSWGTTEIFPGYMAETYFIDGQALDPTSFGETDSATGVWMPKQVTGMTYGTNGYYINFSDNSNNTAATLGKDYSGNGNNWTPNNFSVTAGVGNDSLVDSPTNYGTDTGVGGEVRGDYCTLNPLAASSSSATLTNGNLDISIAANVAGAMGTMAVVSGKWYWEFTAGTASQNAYYVSVCDTAVWFPVGNSQNNMFLSAGVYTYYGNDGNKINAGSSSAYGNSFTSGDVISIALDLDNGKVWFAKNGTWQNSGSPTGGTNAAFTTLAGKTIAPWIGNGASSTSSAGVVNFGQRAFAYTAPSGFKALCTQNLPTPAIGATSTTLASKNFAPVLYTGNSSTQTITTDFQPDLVWIKSRSTTDIHTLQDVLRGSKYYLQSNSTAAETTQADSDGISAFTSTGFTLGYTDSDAWNKSPNTYVSWNWKAGGTGVSNTDGSITSTVSANPTAGISIVGYTGTGANATVGHGLGVAPKMVILKSRSAVKDWIVGNSNYTSWAYIQKLNDSIAQTSVTDIFNSTAPTSSVFSLGGNLTSNTSGATYIAYCFAEVAGFSKFGKYTGNGSTDGSFVYCGFRPRYVMVKRLNTVSNWQTFDGVRDPYNVVDIRLQPNTTNADASGGTSALDFADFLSNGFKLRGTDTDWNASGSDYIFMAFAESPFNYARAR